MHQPYEAIKLAWIAGHSVASVAKRERIPLVRATEYLDAWQKRVVESIEEAARHEIALAQLEPLGLDLTFLNFTAEEKGLLWVSQVSCSRRYVRTMMSWEHCGPKRILSLLNAIERVREVIL